LYLTPVSNTDGESIPVIPDDAELSPELLEALKNNSITPDDIEVIKDEETGKNVVRSKSQMSAAMGGVKEGHIYVPVAKSMCCYCTLPVFDVFPCFSPFFCLNNFVAFINVHCFVARVHRVWYQLV
jgi:hypothetical protein